MKWSYVEKNVLNASFLISERRICATRNGLFRARVFLRDIKVTSFVLLNTIQLFPSTEVEWTG